MYLRVVSQLHIMLTIIFWLIIFSIWSLMYGTWSPLLSEEVVLATRPLNGEGDRNLMIIGILLGAYLQHHPLTFISNNQ